MIGDARLHGFFQEAWDLHATDVLLTDGSPPLLRIDGAIRPIPEEKELHGHEITAILENVLDAEQLVKFNVERELDFSTGWDDKVRSRGNAFMQQGMPAVALRIIPDRIPSFDDLGLPPAVRELAKVPQGLVLFTGPTGSGKSTSMAALIAWIIAHRPCHVLTIEDPVEYLHNHGTAVVSQRAVGSDTLSWNRALRSALREDPDVILVGEMRDTESIGITLTLAETGHLVFSTLHTNDAAQALDRIVDVFPGEMQAQIRVQLAGSLSAIVAQRLIPKAGGGLVAAYEVLTANHAVRNLVREGKSRQIRNVMQTGQADGMQTLEMSLTKLVRAGLITREVAESRSLYPNEIL